MEKEQMNIKIGKETKKRLKTLAKNNEVTVSEFVRNIIQFYLNRLDR